MQNIDIYEGKAKKQKRQIRKQNQQPKKKLNHQEAAPPQQSTTDFSDVSFSPPKKYCSNAHTSKGTNIYSNNTIQTN